MLLTEADIWTFGGVDRVEIVGSGERFSFYEDKARIVRGFSPYHWSNVLQATSQSPEAHASPRGSNCIVRFETN